MDAVPGVEQPPIVEQPVEPAVVEQHRVESPPVVVKREEPPLLLTLRPQEKDWVMGDDVEIKISPLATILDLKALIEEMKGISKHRMQIRLKGKVVVPNRESWALRRTGLYDGYVVLVEPTISGAWYWNTYDYYVDKLIQEVITITLKSPNHRILLPDLEAQIKLPPIFKTSLRVVLRQYPEKIFIYVDTTNNNVWIQRSTKHIQLPVFDPNPIELGTIHYFQPKPFDWEAYADIDDMLKQEEFDPLLGTSLDATAEGAAAVGELTASLDEGDKLDENENGEILVDAVVEVNDVEGGNEVVTNEDDETENKDVKSVSDDQSKAESNNNLPTA